MLDSVGGDLVLTAAHCLGGGTQPTFVRVSVGIPRPTTPGPLTRSIWIRAGSPAVIRTPTTRLQPDQRPLSRQPVRPTVLNSSTAAPLGDLACLPVDGAADQRVAHDDTSIRL
ncbi:hypothetical protein I553_1465 [Mycobacterium xenopi 4042]|uniref:Uncharacterized protein n=1 Tax=Mycobacterium xenopi 4042 TaxID=1299334 RepID=X8CEI9_MYCXE|nr:hypothetical protein I553_1465 [Mycobacterium xenopi 4042]